MNDPNVYMDSILTELCLPHSRAVLTKSRAEKETLIIIMNFSRLNDNECGCKEQ